MSEGPRLPPERVEGGRWWFLLLVPISLLSNPSAAWPSASYYFRDFTLTFYPLRLFTARELREGRLPVWNPFIHEGTFHLPSFYPPDLLHVFSSDPAFVSWLLTLHLPLAALAAYWLVRQMGGGQLGAVTGGVAYSLGGLTLSSLNLYVFLQALALAPLVVGALRRTAIDGTRSLALASVVLAAALSTLAVEFVGQAIVLGAALALVTSCRARTVSRLVLVMIIGVGLAAVPLAITAGFLPETVRGSGFDTSVALGNAVHPAVLLQLLLPNLFGLLAAPAEAWWGGSFFSKGFPYFLSLYVGPVTLALAFVGVGRVERGTRWVLLGLGAVGIWYALGERAGLAWALSRVPGVISFRFPVKAMLLPFLALVVLAGMGIDRLVTDRSAWSRLGLGLAVVLSLGGAVTGLVVWGGSGLAAWSGVDPSVWPKVVEVVVQDAVVAGCLLGGGAIAWLGVAKGRLGMPVAAAALVAILAADLARSGAGMNPQVARSFFQRLPELERVDLDAREHGRVFSYGLDHSPAYRRVLAQGGRGVALAGFYVHRQMLGPYCNILDGIETPESTDLTSFVPRPRELAPEDYDPGRINSLVPWLKNAAVGTVLSLDPLQDPALEAVARVEAGPPGLAIYAYRMADPWPRAYVACRVAVTRGAIEAAAASAGAGFDSSRDVALEGPGTGGCGWGRVTKRDGTPRTDRYGVELDGPGVLVVRGSWARGWIARVDGQLVPVRRANGKHRAVALPAGNHEVELRYEAAGLRAGLWTTLAALGICSVLWWMGRSGRRS